MCFVVKTKEIILIAVMSNDRWVGHIWTPLMCQKPSEHWYNHVYNDLKR